MGNHVENLLTIAAYLRGKEHVDYMDADAAVQLDQAANAMVEANLRINKLVDHAHTLQLKLDRASTKFSL